MPELFIILNIMDLLSASGKVLSTGRISLAHLKYQAVVCATGKLIFLIAYKLNNAQGLRKSVLNYFISVYYGWFVIIVILDSLQTECWLW